MKPIVINDSDKLMALLSDDRLSDTEAYAFRGMGARIARGGELSHKQRCWVDDVYKRLELDAGDVANLHSRGKVPAGKAVPTPEVLKRLPLKPPGRS